MQFNFSKNKWILIIALILFIVPFFWFSAGKLDLGGDSSRLYFLNPSLWLKNICLYTINPLTGFGSNNPNFLMIPFLLLLIALKFILFQSAYLLNCAFSGLLLSGSFFFTSLSIIEILDCEKEKYAKSPAIIGGLMFTLSPLIIYNWERALYFINSLFIYPLIFYLFLRFIKSQKYKYIIIAILATFVFSVNFSFATFPWFFTFFFFTLIFLAIYSLVTKTGKTALKGFCVFIILFLLIHSFQLIPQAANVLDITSLNNQLFSDTAKYDTGLGYFLSVQPYVRLIYNITNQPQYDISTIFEHPARHIIYQFGTKYLYIFFIYPLIIILSGLFLKNQHISEKEKKIFASLLILFLVLLFFMTANINDSLVKLYKSMFAIPGFSMYRSFYDKFSTTYAFFFALIIGMSLHIIFQIMQNEKFKKAIIGFFLVLIIFNGWPLISGKIVNTTLCQSDNVDIPIKIDPKYLLFMDYLRTDQQLDTKYLSFPLTNFQYQLLQGENGGAYFGPSSIAILANKNDFNGLVPFDLMAKGIMKGIERKDYRALNSYFSLLGLSYIFHNADNYIYTKFPAHPYSEQLKTLFPNQKAIKDFIEALSYKKIKQIDFYSLYFNQNSFLPHFFTPQDVIITEQNIETLPQIAAQSDYNIRSAIYSEQQNQNITFDIENKIKQYNAKRVAVFETKKEKVDNILAKEEQINRTSSDLQGKKAIELLEQQKKVLLSSQARYFTDIKNPDIYTLSFQLLTTDFTNTPLFVGSIPSIFINNVEYNIPYEIVETEDHNTKIAQYKIKTDSNNFIHIDNIKLDAGAVELYSNYTLSLDNLVLNKTFAKEIKLPVLEFKQINPDKYIVKVHEARDDFPLVFSERFHNGWRLYPSNNYQASSLNQNLISGYDITDTNQHEQATKDELSVLISNNWISSLGNKKTEFISKNFQNTIQNNNLPNSSLWDTWFQKSLSQENHLIVNGYANSWLIDLEEIKKTGKYIQNPDGSIDFELTVEFWPQRLFYLGIIISLPFLLGCIIYLFSVYFKKT